MLGTLLAILQIPFEKLTHIAIDYSLFVGYNMIYIINMSLLTEAIAQEQRRIAWMISKYETELSSLPKGVLITKSIKGNQYYYLQYRDGKKTVSKYIGRQSDKVEELQKQIDRRRYIQLMLKILHEEYATAQKMMEVRI